MKFDERFSTIAQKSIKHLDIIEARKVLDFLEQLKINPFPPCSKRCKETGKENVLEILFEDYKILYEILFFDMVVLIYNVEKINL